MAVRPIKTWDFPQVPPLSQEEERLFRLLQGLYAVYRQYRITILERSVDQLGIGVLGCSLKGKVFVRRALSPDVRAYVLCHELAHELLGYSSRVSFPTGDFYLSCNRLNGSPDLSEVVADSVAQKVFCELRLPVPVMFYSRSAFLGLPSDVHRLVSMIVDASRRGEEKKSYA